MKNRNSDQKLMYTISVSDDLHPLSVRSSRDDATGITTIEYEYMLTGKDSRDEARGIVPMTALFNRVHVITSDETAIPQAVMDAIKLVLNFAEGEAALIEFPQ